MHFLPIPPYLQNLTILEISLIRRVTVVMNIHLLRYGMLSSKGHCISLPQRMRIATELPLLSSDVGIVVLRRKDSSNNSMRQYTVQRDKVQNALLGLTFGFQHGGLQYPQGAAIHLYTGPDHTNRPLKGRFFEYFPNEYYKDVTIKQDRIDNLPDSREELPDLPCIELPEIIQEGDKGPARNQFVHSIPAEDESLTRSGIVCPLEPKDADTELRIMLNRLLGSEEATDQALQQGQVAGAEIQYTRENPLRELKTPGFFAMAFPNVFVNGSCDFTVPKLVKLSFKDYIQHIYYTGDNRVAKDPYLKFFLLNIDMRMQALHTGSFLVAQQLNDAHLTIAELRHNIENDDASVPRKIIAMASNLVKYRSILA